MIRNLLNDFDIQYTITILFAFVISISFHELAHGWRAYKLGDDTAYNAGRLTMNPLAHLDPIGTLMILLVGVGWAKPVPINPVMFTRAKTMKRGIVEVSLAGPLSNLLISFVSYFTLRVVVLIFGVPQTDSFILSTFIGLFGTLFSLNIFLAIFNLLPVPPLDGFKIFGSLLPNDLYYKFMEYERYIGMIFLVIILFAGGFFRIILDFFSKPLFFIIRTPVDLLFDLLERLF